MSSAELTAWVTALANAIACNLSTDEVALLAVILTQLADTLTTIATQQGLREKMREQKEQ